MSARRLAPLGLLATAALVAAGCGSSSPSPPRADSTLALRAAPDGKLRFDKATLRAASGTLTIELDNPAALSHNIAIEGVAKQGEVVGQHGTSTLTTILEAGTYTYYCAVPGHRQAGMQGTLTVDPRRARGAAHVVHSAARAASDPQHAPDRVGR